MVVIRFISLLRDRLREETSPVETRLINREVKTYGREVGKCPSPLRHFVWPSSLSSSLSSVSSPNSVLKSLFFPPRLKVCVNQLAFPTRLMILFATVLLLTWILLQEKVSVPWPMLSFLRNVKWMSINDDEYALVNSSAEGCFWSLSYFTRCEFQSLCRNLESELWLFEAIGIISLGSS